MTRNYNTTLNKPYIRGQEIIIKYGVSETERVKIVINESEAIVDADGHTNIISGYSNSFPHTISLSDISSETFELINPSTGDEVGQTMSLQTLFVAITSYIRKLQKANYPE